MYMQSSIGVNWVDLEAMHSRGGINRRVQRRIASPDELKPASKCYTSDPSNEGFSADCEAMRLWITGAMFYTPAYQNSL